VHWPGVIDPAAPATGAVLPLVLSQVGVLAATGAYRPRPLVEKIWRLIGGVLLGTVVGAFLHALRYGTFPAGALLGLDVALFLPASLGWRATRVLWTSRVPANAELARFVDRTTERASLIGMLRDLAGHAELLRNLVLRDLKLKYRGSVLGFLWSLANPLAMVLVYTFAFKTIMAIQQPNYHYFVLIGLLAWTFFANASTMSTGAIIESTGLVRAVRFPRAILPVATVFFNLAQYLLTVVVFLPIMFLAIGRAPTWPMALFPVILLLQAAFAVGVALLLSAATTNFRDVRHLVEVILPFLFWTTPILYPMAIVPESVRTLVLLSPMSPFVAGYQSILYDGVWPDPATMIVASVYGLSMFALGTVVFLSLEDELAEQI
jgi:ABC-2 type transport system permease protein